jgi:inhibitor of KinA sporulation pathway (predicted exonuclease)
MNYIVFDLEWNQCPYGKEWENKKLPFEIIEIGAVKLNKNRELIDEFHQVIKPVVYKQLHFRTREVIGINRELLMQGIPFMESARAFLNWCGDDVSYCTWGSTDLAELQRNLKFYGLLHRLKGPLYFFDIQKLFSIAYEDRKKRKSLEDAIDYLDIEKKEEFHRALYDAHYAAEIFKKMPLDCIRMNYSIDCYQNPKTKEEEIRVVYSDYEKFISREFFSKEAAMKDKEVTSTRCFLCGRTVRKKIRWFSINTKNHFCLAICPEHGYLKGKIRMKKTDDGRIYAIKTLKITDEAGAKMIRSKQEVVRKKRYLKRHQE